jgi:hypothetical protein
MSHTNGTFLWISVVQRELRGLRYLSSTDIKRKIDGIPKELDKLYNGVVQGVFEKDPRDVAILTWIT